MSWYERDKTFTEETDAKADDVEAEFDNISEGFNSLFAGGRARTNSATGAILPPTFTYDPGIEAKIRASGRGLKDLEVDTRAGRHFADKDLAQALRDIQTSTKRGVGKIRREGFRNRRELDERASDTSLKGARANQDFDIRLQEIGRDFANLGKRQRESANQAGVLGSGTERAGAAARGINQRAAEAPIHLARQRVAEDLATALGRIGTARHDLGEDETRSLRHFGADQVRDERLAEQGRSRYQFETYHQLQRGRRENLEAKADLTNQAIYEARANRPGAFTKTGQKRKGRR